MFGLHMMVFSGRPIEVLRKTIENFSTKKVRPRWGGMTEKIFPSTSTLELEAFLSAL